ncbi:MAG: hypothetical protein Q6363_002755, partial [Candidatus Njordarchaeota archaeon]
MRDPHWFLTITILILAPRIISELLFRLTSLKMIWVFRIIDIFDITLQTISLFVLILYVFHRYIYGRSEKELIIYLVLSALLIGGHFMHFAANAIDMHYREAIGIETEENMPTTAYILLHFLDEYLSHIILFTAMILIFLYGGILDMQKEQINATGMDKIITILSGFILGGSLGISGVEASIPIYMIAISALCIGIIIYKKIKMDRQIKGLSQYLFTLFVLITLAMIIFAISLYLLILGTQSPRELIGGMI